MSLIERWERYKKLTELEAKVNNDPRIIAICQKAFVAGADEATSLLSDELDRAYKEVNSPVVINKGKL